MRHFASEKKRRRKKTMEAIVTRYINKMLDFEESGYIEGALKLSDKILETFKEDEIEILFERAKMEFRNGLVKEALLNFIRIYEATGNSIIYDLILEAYYLPRKEKMQEVYSCNMKYLKEYPHYRNEKEEIIETVPIWQDEEILVCLNLRRKEIVIQTRLLKKIEEEKDKILMVVNELWMEDILEFERNYRMSFEFMDMNLPLYLVYDKNFWNVFVQLHDVNELIKTNRVVILVGEKEFCSYLREDMVLRPTLQWCYDEFEEIYTLIFKNIVDEQQLEEQKNIEFVTNYYKNHIEDILNRIKSQKPRILFLISKFTTALQYHIRDFMQSAMRCGCDVEMLIEPDGIHRLQKKDVIKHMAQFKPDIIFVIDHFRFERQYIPKEVLCVTWIQDDLPHILDRETPSKLTPRDFILNHFVGWSVIENVGYPPSRMMDAPIVANNYIYKPYDLTEEEKEKYGADICMVCHAADLEDFIVDILNCYKEGSEIRHIIEELLNDYCKLVLTEGEVLYTRREMEVFINQYTERFYNIKIKDWVINDLSQKLMELNQRVFRQALADWLIESGYYIKLWGSGWLKSPKYQGYAMGPAPNGEILSKILQSSKIVLGNNVNATGAARAWESMLSGAFYMSNFVPPEADAVDIRKILKEDENLIVFYDKNDLLKKVKYYLSHENERKQMAEKGHRAALEKMTYDSLVKRMLVFLHDYYKNQEV